MVVGRAGFEDPLQSWRERVVAAVVGPEAPAAVDALVPMRGPDPILRPGARLPRQHSRVEGEVQALAQLSLTGESFRPGTGGDFLPQPGGALHDEARPAAGRIRITWHLVSKPYQ